MRVLYLSLSPVPSHAANSVQVIKTCAAMVRMEHPVRLFCAVPTAGGRSKTSDLDQRAILEQYGVEDSFEIFRFPLVDIRLIGRALYGRRLSMAITPYLSTSDLIYGREIYALVAAKNHDLPIVYEAHTPPPNLFKSIMHHNLFRSPNFKRLVTVSYRLGEYFEQNYPELRSKEIVVAPNGADDPFLTTGSDAPVYPSAGSRSVGFVGQLYEHKGPQMVVDLAKRMQDTDFHVVGGSPDDIAYWKERATENITFHGFVGQRELEDFYRSFKVVLAPYRRAKAANRLRDDTEWGSPLKMFEYMAHGCCIVASDLPVIREITGDDEAALLCSPIDSEEWEHAVKQLLNDEGRRCLLSQTARGRFLHNYTREEKVRRVLG